MTENNLNIDYQKTLKSCINNPKIILYRNIILKENKRINLVSRETIEANFYNLVAESVIPVDYLEIIKIKTYLDIGSGGGLPSIPVLLTHNVEKAVLVERTQKKAAALSRILDKLSTESDISIFNHTFEDISLDSNFDLITLRYVKLNEILLRRVLKNLNQNGIIIYYSDYENKKNSKDITSVTYSYTTSLEPHNKYFTVIRKK